MSLSPIFQMPWSVGLRGSSPPLVFGLCLLMAGCASTRPAPPLPADLGGTTFTPVAILDFRRDTVEDYRTMVQPGDLIVNTMRPGRAAKKQEWLFAILPHGHAMIVLDPQADDGILECRFHGVRRVGPEELRLYSYNSVYRLRDRERLNIQRLNLFATVAVGKVKRYSFKSWLGLNDQLRPNTVDQISPWYTCSTAVAAAYHFAGVTLRAAREENRVITPRSLATSPGVFNEFALHPAVEHRTSVLVAKSGTSDPGDDPPAEPNKLPAVSHAIAK